MWSNKANCVEGVHFRLKFFIESLFSLIFIVIHNAMLVGSRLLCEVIKLLILHVMIFVVTRHLARDLTRLQTARLGVLTTMTPGLAAPEVSLVKHDLSQLANVEDTAADGLPAKLFILHD